MRNLVLGLLAKEPAHGYELKERLEATLGRLWSPINDGQIYVTLNRLERDGLVVSEVVEQEDRPDRRVFALTAAGREELDEWLGAVQVAPRPRDGFLLQLATVLTVPDGPDALGLIDRQRRALLRRVREVQLLEDGAEGVTERLAIELNLMHLQADLRWLEACEDALSEDER